MSEFINIFMKDVIHRRPTRARFLTQNFVDK